MSEKIKFNPEKRETLPALPTAEQAEPLRDGEADPKKALEQARANVSETVQSDTQPNPLEALKDAQEASQAPSPRTINRDLKKITLRRELREIRRKLPVADRALSRVIHQPVVRAVSEGAGKTISRPSGLLGGGLVAFTGTTAYLFIAKRQGFEYNYLVFLVLLATGFGVGLILELFVSFALRGRRHQD